MALRPQPGACQSRGWVRPGHLRGRDTELAAIARLLDGSDTAIAPAWSGQGGIGKTQLAMLYAHQYADCHPKGVFWLSLADVADNPGKPAECGEWSSPDSAACRSRLCHRRDIMPVSAFRHRGDACNGHTDGRAWSRIHH